MTGRFLSSCRVRDTLPDRRGQGLLSKARQFMRLIKRNSFIKDFTAMKADKIKNKEDLLCIKEQKDASYRFCRSRLW